MAALLRGAVQYAREHNAKIVEGYPIDLQFIKLAGQRLNRLQRLHGDRLGLQGSGVRRSRARLRNAADHALRDLTGNRDANT